MTLVTSDKVCVDYRQQAIMLLFINIFISSPIVPALDHPTEKDKSSQEQSSSASDTQDKGALGRSKLRSSRTLPTQKRQKPVCPVSPA